MLVPAQIVAILGAPRLRSRAASPRSNASSRWARRCCSRTRTGSTRSCRAPLRALRPDRGLRHDPRPQRSGAQGRARSACRRPSSGCASCATTAPRPRPGEAGRDRRPRPDADDGLLQAARPHRAGDARRLAAHRRRRLRRRGRLPAPRRPHEGHDRFRRREGLSARHRGGRRAPSRRARGRRVRRAAREVGRDAGRGGDPARRAAASPPRRCATGSTSAWRALPARSAPWRSWRTFRAAPPARRSSASCARRTGRRSGRKI